jgi:hypothetical protein
MTRPAEPPPAADHGFLAPTPDRQPVDHCFRCGKETPVGVGLCDEHNPKQLSGPSATQMHATVFAGIVLGVIGLFVLFRLTLTDAGPFSAQVTSSGAGAAAGSVAVAVSITNEGDSEGHADCRFTRDGVPRPDDVAFRTPAMAGGESISLERELTPEPDSPVSYVPELLSVICR